MYVRRANSPSNLNNTCTHSRWLTRCSSISPSGLLSSVSLSLSLCLCEWIIRANKRHTASWNKISTEKHIEWRTTMGSSLLLSSSLLFSHVTLGFAFLAITRASEPKSESTHSTIISPTLFLAYLTFHLFQQRTERKREREEEAIVKRAKKRSNLQLYVYLCECVSFSAWVYYLCFERIRI